MVIVVDLRLVSSTIRGAFVCQMHAEMPPCHAQKNRVHEGLLRFGGYHVVAFLFLAG